VSTPAATELRTAMIAAVKASALITATAMGAQPRVHSMFAPPEGDPGAAFPFVVITMTEQPWDTTTERGAEFDISFHLLGEYEGGKQGEAIFWALQQLFRDWAPQDFSAHHLTNLEFRMQDVRPDEDGKRYFGLQRWRAVTEEL